MEKNCIFCGLVFSKKYTYSKKYWETQRFCSHMCASKYKVGISQNLATKEKLSISLKKAYAEGRKTASFLGKPAWNRGTKGIVKPNSGSFKKGQPAPKTAFKKGQRAINPFPKGGAPWNKGLKWEAMRGEKHPNWKGGKPKTYRRETLSYEDYRKYKDWQKEIFKRDGWTCRFCNKHGGLLHADHIKSWYLYPELRFELDNGRTLCPPCHRKTPSYGKTFQYDIIKLSTN